MRISTLLWGAASVAAGALVATAALPGAASWSLGPRIGVAAVLLTLGFLLLAGPWVAFAVRRASAKETGGTCPVGATCACGHFNFKPRRSCRACGKDTVYPA